jgi:hypothetical protein
MSSSLLDQNDQLNLYLRLNLEAIGGENRWRSACKTIIATKLVDYCRKVQNSFAKKIYLYSFGVFVVVLVGSPLGALLVILFKKIVCP